jgi:hypothetical protein
MGVKKTSGGGSSGFGPVGIAAMAKESLGNIGSGASFTNTGIPSRAEQKEFMRQNDPQSIIAAGRQALLEVEQGTSMNISGTAATGNSGPNWRDGLANDPPPSKWRDRDVVEHKAQSQAQVHAEARERERSRLCEAEREREKEIERQKEIRALKDFSAMLPIATKKQQAQGQIQGSSQQSQQQRTPRVPLEPVGGGERSQVPPRQRQPAAANSSRATNSPLPSHAQSELDTQGVAARGAGGGVGGSQQRRNVNRIVDTSGGGGGGVASRGQNQQRSTYNK